MLLLLPGLLALLPAASAAQEPGALARRFEAVGQNGAIPNNVLSALAQDQAGFLWVGSAAGLQRFDGYNFRPLYQDAGRTDEKKSLGFVRQLLLARDGRLWISSDTGGLFVHDPLRETVQAYAGSGPQGAGPLPAGTLNALAEDRDGAIWAGSGLDGLARLDPASAEVRIYRPGPAPGSLPNGRIQSLLVDRQGTLWIGGFGGLARKRAGSEYFEAVPLDGVLPTRGSPTIVLHLYQSSQGQIWLGTQQGDLLLLDPASGALRRIEAGGARGAVYAITEASAEEVWVGRAGGIELRAPSDGRLLQTLRHNPRNASSLGGNEVRSLLRDRAGWLWVGGFGGGLQRHAVEQRSIGVRKLDETDDAVFDDPNARSLLELDNGEIWVGTTARGVGVLDSQLRVRRSFRPLSPGTQAAGGEAAGAEAPVRVGTQVQLADGSIWLGVESQLLRVDRRGQVLQTVATGPGRLRRTVAARDGGLWVGTQDGLYRLAPGAGSLQRLGLDGGQPLRGDVNALTEGPDGDLWVGAEAGLFHLPAGASVLRPVPGRDGQGLRNSTVTGLLLDRQRVLWVDTAGGLHRMSAWDGRAARFEPISERHGIGGRAYGANLLEDGRGRIWSQLYVYDPARDHLHQLTPADGADAGTSWFRSYLRLRDGRFLFGAGKGLMVVEPDRFEGWTYAPPLVLSELRVDGQRRPARELSEGLALSPRQRGFSAEFAALDYSDPGRCRYLYKLDGFDRDWMETGAELRVASYSNLNPGRYTLRVRASNRSGVWSPHELSLPLRVLPAWWQTWWARLAFLLLALAGLHALVRWRTRYLERRQRALELRVGERTAELEQLSQALRQKSVALEELSLSDPLTGLRNRRFLAQHIEADIALSLRRHEGRRDDAGRGAPADDADLIFFLLDIDHFKDINDSHGHAAGDAVLQQMQGRLRQVFRDTDHLVRWGGEEFLIVARGSARAHAPELAERMRALVAGQPFVLADGQELAKTCSIGFACYPLVPEQARAFDWHRVVDLADAALYEVKRQGRDGWQGVLRLRPEAVGALSGRKSADWLGAAGVELLRSGPEPGPGAPDGALRRS